MYQHFSEGTKENYEKCQVNITCFWAKNRALEVPNSKQQTRWNTVLGIANTSENCTISWFIYFYKNGSRSVVSSGKNVNEELKKKYMKETCLEYCMVICQDSQGCHVGSQKNLRTCFRTQSETPGLGSKFIGTCHTAKFDKIQEIWSGKLLDLFSSLFSTNSIKVFYAKGGWGETITSLQGSKVKAKTWRSFPKLLYPRNDLQVLLIKRSIGIRGRQAGGKKFRRRVHLFVSTE